MNAQMNQAPNGREKVTVELVGQDGNAFAVIGRCERAMRQARWTAQEITAFRMEATCGDYNHLLATVMEYCEDASEDEEEEEFNFYADDEDEEEDTDD